MSRRAVDLSTLSWQLGMVARQPFGAAPADDRGQVLEWLPARIPGDIRADLIAAGRIPPVESPEGIAAGAWVDDFDWWYRAELPVRLVNESQVGMLEADGIDYYSAIWLDGALLATHVGMFDRQTLCLPAVDFSRPRELALRVWGGGALPRNSHRRHFLGGILDRLHPGLAHLSDRMATAKAQFSFGWDFSPRLLSAGIWDNMRVVVARGAYIEDLWGYGEPVVETEDLAPVRWHLRARVISWTDQPVRAVITIAPDNFAGSGYEVLYRTIDLCTSGSSPCTDEYDFELEMAVARLWWPWDQGEPALYRVTVSLQDDRGVLDEVSQVLGARTVRRDLLPGGAPWRFVVNGKPQFLRGANWVPADVLPGRVTADDYARLLGMARSGGANFLRVWGGGLREKQAFWETCDRLGLMAWQEFPLACDFLDRYPSTPAYLNVLASQAQGIVRALRSHPSLIAWCGGNEIDTARESHVLRLVAEAVAENDPTRPWFPASPSGGDVHQWDVWHGLVPWQELAAVSSPFMSEFGLQAPPGSETLAEMFPDGVPDSWHDPRWVKRLAQPDKLLHYAAGSAGTSGEMAAVMQRVQSAALQLGLETCRLRRDTCGGVALWQFDEPWPAVSWAIIDHAGRPKLAYFMLQGSFQPLMVAARFARLAYASGEPFAAEIWLVNDGPLARTGCRLEAGLDGTLCFVKEGVTVEPASATRIGEFAHQLTASPSQFELRLSGPGGAENLASNCYDLTVPLAGPQPRRSALMRRLAGRVLEAG